MLSAVDPKLNILLLCSGASANIGTVLDHLAVFAQRSLHYVQIIDSKFAAETDIDLDRYDVVVFHYSVVLSDPNHIRPALEARLKVFTGLKVAFIQDECRWIDRQNESIESYGISLIYTVTNQDVTRQIYRTSYFDTVRFEHTLTGFVPEHLLEIRTPDYAGRPIDVSYRARRIAACYGAFAEQKFTIGERFRDDAKREGLICDIESAESRRIYGADWIKFVASSKATLGTESGVSFIDFTGQVLEKAEAYERDHPDVPPSAIRDMFLDGRDGELTIKVISPRVFEAAALRTLLVLYPGAYSGVLVPWRHYVPLAFDHSNISEVIAVIRSPERASKIIETAYREVARNKTFWLGTMIGMFDKVVAEEYRNRVAPHRELRSFDQRLASDLAAQWSTCKRWDVLASENSSYRAAFNHLEFRILRRARRAIKGVTKKLRSFSKNAPAHETS